LFKEAGYTTGSFGKWHLGNDPLTQGIDVNVGGNQRGNPGPKGYFSPFKVQNITPGPSGENLTNRLTEEAIRFIHDNQKNPFFLYLPYYAVHTPLQTFTELEQKYSEKGGSDLQNNVSYAGMVETVDTNIGKLLTVLSELELSNTLIIFTSDNGGIRAISSQHPLRAGKGSYYEGGIRVPYIMYWPGVIKPNSVNNTPISHLDFFPTFIDMLGMDKPDHSLDGVSLVPLMNGRQLEDRPLYFHFPIYLEAYNKQKDDGRDHLFRTRPGSVIIDGKWKLHEYFEDSGLELYDLESDPGERTNLALEQPEKTKELLQKLRLWRTELNAPVPTIKNKDYDPELNQ
jgi:arylsulfatase A-like enzyme